METPERFIACATCGHRFDHHEDIGCVEHLFGPQKPLVDGPDGRPVKPSCDCAGFVDSGRAA